MAFVSMHAAVCISEGGKYNFVMSQRRCPRAIDSLPVTEIKGETYFFPRII